MIKHRATHFLICIGGLLTTAAADSFLPAFPGAEGCGSATVGGRGGKVIAVTNLNDRGPGSLRAAIDAQGPRIVIFNWRHRTMDGGDETSLVNIINNYYKPGPATRDNMLSTIARIDRLEVQLARMLNGGTKDNGGATQSAAPKGRRKRRKMSAAARAKISAAQRKRWKAQKAAN